MLAKSRSIQADFLGRNGKGKNMKEIITVLKLTGTFALLMVGFCACTSYKVENKESLLSSAGFRSHTPSTQTQWVMFKGMTPYKLERNTKSGKALYSYADPQRGVVYIGGDKAYQRYRQLALQESIEEKEVEASYSNYLKTIDQAFSENYD